MQDDRLVIEDVDSRPVSEDAEGGIGPAYGAASLRHSPDADAINAAAKGLGLPPRVPVAELGLHAGGTRPDVRAAAGAVTGTGTGPPVRRAPSVAVRALRDDLRGAIGGGAPARANGGARLGGGAAGGGFLARLRAARAARRVLVEGAPMGTKDCVFFAPDNCLSSTQATPTQFVNVDPRATPHVVRRGDAFEVTFLGVSVSPPAVGGAAGGADPSDVLLYSLARPADPFAPGTDIGLHSLPSASTISAGTDHANGAAPGNGSGHTLGSGTDEKTDVDASPRPSNGGSRGGRASASSGMQPRALSSSGIQSIPSQHLGAALLARRALSMNGPSFPFSLASPHVMNANLHSIAMVAAAAPPPSLFGAPTGVSATVGDMPFIHYDPVIDGHDGGQAVNAYIPIPATKALYLRSLGRKSSTAVTNTTAAIGGVGDGGVVVGTTNDDDEDDEVDDLPHSISVRFTIMQVDKASDMQARAVSGVDHLGSYVSPSAESVPYLELLTRAFAVASSMGRSGLKRYEKPDHVHSVDMEFLLADREEDTDHTSLRGPPCGNYLQVSIHIPTPPPLYISLYSYSHSPSHFAFLSFSGHVISCLCIHLPGLS